MNELLFLGTGAADWLIEESGEENKEIRRNSSALINGELMLDCGPHVFHYQKYVGGEDLFDKVKYLLITHDHSDHMNPDNIRALADHHPMTVICDEYTQQEVGTHPGITYLTNKPYERIQAEQYQILPILANHDVVTMGNRQAVHYIITMPDGKNLFYGLDGAWFLRPSWETMKEYHFDVMVLDCTVGDSPDWRLFEHNTIPMLRTMIEEIRRIGMLAPGGHLVASHLARTLHLDHASTAAILDKEGMETAYDGLKMRF